MGIFRAFPRPLGARRLAGAILVSCTNAAEGKMLSPRFLRLYADKCRRSAQVINNLQPLSLRQWRVI